LTAAGTSRLFGVGIGGPVLEAAEREILARHPPRAVILFRRNVESEEQLRRLAADVRAAAGDVFLCVDQEGGPVDRLRDLAGPFPSFRAAAVAGESRQAGELAGEACARLGFALDLAPVVDRRVGAAGEAVLGERTAAEDPGEVVEAAAAFLDGLRSRGVGGCLKHFPGLGRARRDTHEALPVLDDDPDERERDLAPFRALMPEAGAVMVSHAATPADGLPASLSRDTATGLLREGLGFDGVTLSDDLEMGALAEFGGLAERSAGAARAGCDLLFVCSRIGEYPACVERVEADVPEWRRAEATRRIDEFARRLRELSASRPSIEPRPLAEIAVDVAALRERIARSGGFGGRPV
jgi:beta-N-acetylhexosaminidase